MKHFNRRAWLTALLLSVLAAVLAGCGGKADAVLSLGQEETKAPGAESAAGTQEQEASDGEEDAGTAQDPQTAGGAEDAEAAQGSDSSDGTDAADGQAASGVAESSGNADTLSDASEGTMAVYVCGAVAAPGVYEVAEDMRLVDAVELAGGFLAEADTTWWNLAGKLADGAMYYIPTVSETAEEDFSLPSGEGGTGDGESDGELSGSTADGGDRQGADSGQTGEQADSEGESTASDGLVSINTATKEELTALPGIGDTKAAAIITYRETNGPFTAIDEIMNVTGIGESTYEKLKDYICL